MRHLFDSDEEYEAKRCTFVKPDGQRCKGVRINSFQTCYHHQTPEERRQYERIKKGIHPTDNSLDAKVPCRFQYRNGKQCQGRVLQGRNVCWAHATPQERRQWRKDRRQKKDKHLDPNLAGAAFPKQHKPYDGYLATADNERIVEVADGEVYGFYGGAFLTKEQRELFKSAPVGDIDDDIRVTRMLLRDALENQMLYIQAQAEGSVEKGFVIFSKEVAETVDEDGRVIVSNSKTIKRRRDYLKDIAHLQKLVTNMETARITILKAQEDMDTEVNPFTFNVLPPSVDHPLYGEKDPEEISE